MKALCQREPLEFIALVGGTRIPNQIVFRMGCTVKLVNAVFFAHHGVMSEEHRVGGRFEVDVAMEMDFREAAMEDNLHKTVDYEQTYNLVREIVTQNKVYLIERLAYLIGERVLAEQDVVNGVEVIVRKVNPPVGGPCDRAEAIYQRHR